MKRMPSATVLLFATSLLASCSGRESQDIAVDQAAGPCPKCEVQVVGQMTLWDGQDSEGNPVWGAEYRAKCECGAQLYRPDAQVTNRNRVEWQTVLIREDSNKIQQVTSQ